MNKNIAIEELAHAVDLASTVYTNWVVETDAYNYVIIEAGKQKVEVQASVLAGNDLVIETFTGGINVFYIRIPANQNVAFAMLVPMIEQHLNGDRSELKSALTDYLRISPAIN
jgi:hypothetical protein